LVLSCFQADVSFSTAAAASSPPPQQARRSARRHAASRQLNGPETRILRGSAAHAPKQNRRTKPIY
jgi:hypothetical protein